MKLRPAEYGVFVVPLIPLAGLWVGGMLVGRAYAPWHLAMGYVMYYVSIVFAGYVSGRWNNPKINGVYYDWFTLVVAVALFLLNARALGPLVIDPVLVGVVLACVSSIRFRRDLDDLFTPPPK